MATLKSFSAPISILDTTTSTSNITGALTVSGGIGISNTTDATSITNGGTITTSGGAAIAKSLFVGSNVVVGNTTQSNTDFSLELQNSSTANVTIAIVGVPGHFSNSAVQGDTVIRSGVNNLILQSGSGYAALIINTSNIVSIPGTTTSTNNTTGALTVAGGVGIAGAMNVGSTITASGLITANLGLTVLTGQTTNIGTTGTTSPLNVYGLITGTNGLTISSGNTSLQTLSTAGLITANLGLTVTSGSTSLQALSTAGLITANLGLTVLTGQTANIGTTGTTSPLNVYGLITGTNGLTISSGNTSLQALSTSGVVNITNNTISTSTITGSLTVAGGIGSNGTITSLTQILQGSTSGFITIQPQAAAGTYNFNLPTTSGLAGQYLTSQGGGSTAMTWSNSGSFNTTGNTTPANSTLYVNPASTTGTTGTTLYFSYYTTPPVTLTTGAITNAYTLYINGQPSITGGGTITNSYALYINSGSSLFGGNVNISSTTTSTSSTTGALTIGGGIGIGGSVNIASSLDTQSINPDAYNSLLVYEDQTLTTVYSGTVAYFATYVQNNYIQLTPATNGTSGQYYWNINPGNSFIVTFDAFNGTNSGGDEISFFWYCTAAPTGTANYNTGLTNGYNLILQEFTGANQPGISLWSNFGTTVQLGSTYGNAATVGNNSFNQVTIIYIRNTIRVLFNGITVITYKDTTNRPVNQLNNYMGFSSYCAASQSNTHNIRNIRIAKTNEGLWQYSSPSSNVITSNASTINISATTTSTSTITGALTIGGGVGIGGDANIGGILYANQNSNPPTFTTRSTGTKYILFNALSGTVLDYALGIEGFNMWFSSGGGFKWYNNSTTPIMQINGSSTLINTSVPGTNASLSIGGGNVAAGGSNSSIVLNYQTGSQYSHLISTRHNAAANVNTNAIDFWLNNSTTSTGSTTPGTGNVNGMSITAVGVGIFNSTPSYTLDVTGTARINSNLTIGGNLNVGGSSSIAHIATFWNTTTQAISANTNTYVLFPSADSNSYGTPNIGYSNGVFTNNNSFTVVVHVSCQLYVPGISGQVWFNTPNLINFAGQNTSTSIYTIQQVASFPIVATQSFSISVYLASATNIGSSTTPNRINCNTIQIMVLK